MKIIFCAGGNRRFAQTAIKYRFTYGSQMPETCYFPPYFIDLDPNRLPKQPVYVGRLRRYKPPMASVHDWSELRRLPEILMRAEEIAQHTDRVVLIPKVPGGVKKLPRFVGGKPVILGYSVPTGHGATDVEIKEFKGWPVHILGGSPIEQLKKAREISEVAEVVSMDGNYALKMATRYNQFFAWPAVTEYRARNRHWPTLKESNKGEKWGDGTVTAGAPYEAFERSCEAIMRMWSESEFVIDYGPEIVLQC